VWTEIGPMVWGGGVTGVEVWRCGSNVWLEAEDCTCVHLTDRANATCMRRLIGLRGIDWQVRFDSSTMRCIKRGVSAEMVSAMQCSRAQFLNKAISFGSEFYLLKLPVSLEVTACSSQSMGEIFPHASGALMLLNAGLR
jgi:hypothetical protein